MMTQKEFKTTMLERLNAALETARDFDKDDLSEIESLRGGISYQIRQLDYAPSYKSEDELKIYRKEIKERIKELNGEINSVYRKYGWIVIRFPNDKGQYRLVNARQEIQRVISKVRGLTDAKLQPKKYIFRTDNPSAAKFEIFEGIVKINQEGWFTDGHVLVKGEAPKDAELIYPDKKPAEVDWMLKLEGNPATRLYFFFDRFQETGRQFISDRPLPTFQYKNGSRQNSIDPSVVFESDGRFWCYNQNKYNFIINRHHVDRYEIVFDTEKFHFGELIFYIGDEFVALMMPYREGKDEVYVTEPPLKELAIKAGLIKTKEVAVSYTSRRIEGQMRLGL